MSLINDALKRTNEHQARKNAASDLGGELLPIESAPDQTRLWPIGLFAACLVGSLWFAWIWWHGNPTETAEDMGGGPTEVAARSPASPATVPSVEEADPEKYEVQDLPKIPRPANRVSAAVANPPSAPLAEAQVAKQELPAPAPVAPTPSAPPPQPAPATVVARTAPPVASPAPSNPAPTPATSAAQTTFPALALQGIYYRPTRPAAVINARTVYVGDRVANAKILAIDRREVTVQWKSEVRVLAFK